MPDLTTTFLPDLQRYRLPGLNLPDEMIYPAYNGQSILNIPSSICHWFGLPGLGVPALRPELLEAVRRPHGDYQRIVFILMDALALHRLRRWMGDGTAPIWARLADQGLLAPLTSISPSTTSAAITSLWSGRSAAEHGITGYEMWMREYGVVANTILHSAMSFWNDTGGLERAGFKPETSLSFETLGTHLKGYGVQSYAYQHYSIARSGLSRMLFRDVTIQDVSTVADLWVNLRRQFEEKPHERQYVWVYWGEVDHLGHFYNPDDERVAAEFGLFSHALEKLFLERLPDVLREDTLLVLAADHGQLTTRSDPYYELRNHPNLTRRLHIQPTGENRLTYFHIRPGQTEAVREYVERTWPNQFAIFDSAYVTDAGLFGAGPFHPDLLERVGDMLLISLNEAYFWWANKDNILVGRHGGLHPDEMLVPFLAAAL